jgi:hypothetical protein
MAATAAGACGLLNLPLQAASVQKAKIIPWKSTLPVYTLDEVWDGLQIFGRLTQPAGVIETSALITGPWCPDFATDLELPAGSYAGWFIPSGSEDWSPPALRGVQSCVLGLLPEDSRGYIAMLFKPVDSSYEVLRKCVERLAPCPLMKLYTLPSAGSQSTLLMLPPVRTSRRLAELPPA